jgi:CRISPR-associated protein Csd1
MLDRLLSYAESEELATEPGFCAKEIRWAVLCDTDGRFLGVQELGDTDRKRNPGRRFARCPDLSQPEIKRGGAGTRHFLADTAEILALVGHDEPDAKLLAKHRYFVSLLEQAAHADPSLAPAAACLGDPERIMEIRARLEQADAKKNDRATVAIEGQSPLFPLQSDSWHAWWRQFRKQFAAERPAEQGDRVLDLSTGERVRPARTHPKVRGLIDVGGHSAGDVLAGYKQSAFRSYGLVQAENAPLSEESAATYTAALNRLVSRSRKLSSVRIAYWYKRTIPPEDDPLPFLTDPQLEKADEHDALRRVRKLLEAIEQGDRPELANNEYYSLTLSGASGRVMVRDWMEGSFPDLLKSVLRWFEDLAIVKRDGSGMAKPPKFFALLYSLVRDLRELPAPLEARLWRCAMRGEALPFEILGRALPKIRSEILQDEPIRHARIGLLRAFHVRRGDDAMTPGLNEDYPHPAYQCGRLLAVLAAIQRNALGDVGAGVVQRFYGAASTTPSLALGRMMQVTPHHLQKIAGERPRLAHWFEEKLASVAVHISPESLPKTLGLEEQSLFALGYYHEVANRNTSTTTPENDEETTDV